MADTEAIFLNMKDEIERAASIQEAEILEEIKQIREEAYASIKGEAKREADMRMDQEIKDLKSQNAFHISNTQKEMSKKLREKRDGYVDALFSDVKKRLIEYTESEDYMTFLIKKRDQIIDELGECVLYVNNKDLRYKDDLANDQVKEIKSDSTISIGGLRGSNDSLVVDESLDHKLETEKEWFYTHSGLVIK